MRVKHAQFLRLISMLLNKFKNIFHSFFVANFFIQFFYRINSYGEKGEDWKSEEGQVLPSGQGSGLVTIFSN